MTTKFPSMPPYQPATPEGDGVAHVRIRGDNVVIVGNGYTLVIPGHTIEKNSVIIKPGNEQDFNKVQLTLLASEVVYEDDNRDDIKVQPAPMLLHGARYQEGVRAAAGRIREMAAETIRKTPVELPGDAATNLREAAND